MSPSASYTPSTASGAQIRKNGNEWTLVLGRDLSHPPAKVWTALTDPEQLRQWAPFDADRNLGTVGAAKLTTVGAPKPRITETEVKRADPSKALEFNWGGGDLRWELAPTDSGGTKLTLWANINRKYIAMGAAGWHVCFEVLERLLADQPIGRLAGPAAMAGGGWEQLHADYQKLLGVETPGWS